MTTITLATTSLVTRSSDFGEATYFGAVGDGLNDRFVFDAAAGSEPSVLSRPISKYEVSEYVQATIARMRKNTQEAQVELLETEAMEPVEPSNLSTVAPEVSIRSRPRVWPSGTAVYAAPIEIFEGVVQFVDSHAGVMHVTLNAKTRVVPDHAAEIAMRWVNEQDKPLVKPGAVFYLSLYRERRGKTVRNTEEIRFRRLPSWTKAQMRGVRQDAQKLLGKLTTRPLLDE
jgi:hypothetical protein